MRLAIDCDGVLCDWNTAFLRLLTETSGRALATPQDTGRYLPPVWNWPRAMGYTRGEIDTAWRATEKHDWWETLEPLPGARAFLDRLHERCYDDPDWEVVFLTSRQRKTPFIKLQTERWLVNHGFCVDPGYPPLPTVLVGAEDKGAVCKALRLEGLIDDHPEYLTAARLACGPGFRSFLFATPYNIGHVTDDAVRLLYTLDEFWKETV